MDTTLPHNINRSLAITYEHEFIQDDSSKDAFFKNDSLQQWFEENVKAHNLHSLPPVLISSPLMPLVKAKGIKQSSL